MTLEAENTEVILIDNHGGRRFFTPSILRHSWHDAPINVQGDSGAIREFRFFPCGSKVPIFLESGFFDKIHTSPKDFQYLKTAARLLKVIMANENLDLQDLIDYVSQRHFHGTVGEYKEFQKWLSEVSDDQR